MSKIGKENSTPPVPRELPEIQSEYEKVSAITGDKTYQAKVLEAEIEALHQKMWNLQQEAKNSREREEKRKERAGKLELADAPVSEDSSIEAAPSASEVTNAPA